MKSLSGKVAVVSGASSGIGAAIARALSERGAHVILNHPNTATRQAAQQVLDSLPGKTHSIAVEADLSTIDGPRQLIEATAKEFGKLHILVNNAGISELGAIDEQDDIQAAHAWETIMNVNGRGTWFLTRAALSILTRDSRIINIGSSTSRDPDPNMSIYAGSKGMIESFTRCWARDLPRRYGCTVNTVAPGPVSTEKMLSSPPEFQDLVRKRLEKVPVATRMASPEEIAWTVAMLCEDSAGWLNGLWIPVTGGAPLL